MDKLKIIQPVSHNARMELKVWEVKRSAQYPQGIKFTFTLIYKGQSVLRYDNADGKGNHKHIIDAQTCQETQQYLGEQDPFTLIPLFKKEMTEVLQQYEYQEDDI